MDEGSFDTESGTFPTLASEEAAVSLSPTFIHMFLRLRSLSFSDCLALFNDLGFAQSRLAFESSSSRASHLGAAPCEWGQELGFTQQRRQR